MISVVVAAHDEEAVIGSCLDALLEGAAPGELDVIVVANGCHDDTFEIASSRPSVRVLALDQASKVAALNAGDSLADGFPRIYLDADILVPTGAAMRLARAVDDVEGSSRAARAAVPARRLDLSGRPVLVRAYFAINRRLPAFEHGLFGRGMIALSSAGRARFEDFPDVVADDLFLDSLFTDAEKIEVKDVVVVIATPFHTRDLVRRLVRVRRGNAAMRRSQYPTAREVVVRKSDPLSWLRDVVLPRPWLAPAALAYVTVTLVAALLARRPPRAGMSWGRDESTRSTHGRQRSPRVM